MSHPRGSLGDLIESVPPRKPRRTPAKTVKGKDIELFTEDGVRAKVDTKAQEAFLPKAPKPESRIERLRKKSPFERMADILKGKTR